MLEVKKAIQRASQLPSALHEGKTSLGTVVNAKKVDNVDVENSLQHRILAHVDQTHPQQHPKP